MKERLECMENIINDGFAKGIVSALAALDGIEAIALGGSRANGITDNKSDFDIYVYCRDIPPENMRLRLLKENCSRIELGNTYWEYEDDVTLKSGIDMDILYRNPDSFAHDIADVAERFNAKNGYTTCMWYNLVNCKILYDENGRLGELQKKYTRPYPSKLKENIIERNMRLLSGNLPSYDGQIQKAARRKDLISVNHRTAEFFASYFDVIFALNEKLHPGEKKLLDICERQCAILPVDFRTEIENLLKTIYTDEDAITDNLKRIIDNLKALLKDNYAA